LEDKNWKTKSGRQYLEDKMWKTKSGRQNLERQNLEDKIWKTKSEHTFYVQHFFGGKSCLL
jgi:hypothetical protein